ncbi:splicing factor PWI domain-containing protein isoform X1 [Iris pallida]|uniref:Splicing factor PWI domain-containing protein isoform X1 n=1 Tax=Iris pallida TaxID=29817 RepID=A0AAX6GES4_IRIPA|nr:splicing factor PWI domain-containing protein isoform X1 [Iris pallida]
MVYGVPDISGIILVVLGLFWWISVDNFWLENICRYLLAHFPVLGLSRNRGSAAQFFYKNYILLISNWLSKMNFQNRFSDDDRTGLWAPAKCKRTGPTGR